MRLVTLGLLVLDAVLLAMVELLFLPLRLGGWPFPVVIVLAAVTNPWLVRMAAEPGGSALTAGAPLGAWAVTVVVFGTAGPGGDVLLPADWRSLLLLAAGLFPAAMALGRALQPALASGSGGPDATKRPPVGPSSGSGDAR